MTLSSIGSTAALAANTATNTATNAAANPSATAASAATQAQNAPTQDQDASTRVTLSTLSEQAGIVATLDRGASGVQTYDATGLLNAVAAAGNAAAATPAPSPTAPGTSSAQDPASDTSVSSGTSVAAAVPGDWGSILKSNPALTSVAVADAVAQGIVNTINVYV